MQSPIRIGICRPNRSDNGPTINCPRAEIARKIVIVEVTTALETRRSAAIAGSEGRKILVARIPVAANAQITALLTVAVRRRVSVAGALLRTTSMLMACVSRAC
jgi:2-phospho-L-lactate guanylyltransferase (CobY/MobA/RfbA family)